MSKEHEQMACTVTRIAWLDIAKGLGVLLVVIGHFWYNCLFPIVNQMIYSFHVPMFFILSGFVFKKGNLRFGSFAVSKSKRLLLPTFIYLLLDVLLFLYIGTPYITVLKGYFFFEGICLYNAPCWYFFTLFQLLVIGYFLHLDKLSVMSKGVVAAAAFLLGLVIYKFEIFIPFGINRTFISLGFFVLGSMLKHVKPGNKKSVFRAFIMLCCFALWILSGVVFNGKISLYGVELGNYFLFIAAGICGSILAFALSQLLQKTVWIKRFLIRTANNSMLIIGTHYFLKLIVEGFMRSRGLLDTWQYSLFVLVFSIVAIWVYNFIAVFLKKYFPAVTGDLK